MNEFAIDMKKTAFFLFLVFNSCSLFAQKADTVKRMVDGVVMTSADDVIQNLSRSGEFSTFISLIKKAGLTDTLKNLESITIFAPDNRAFQKLDTGWINDAGKASNKEFLRSFLLNHAFSGKITAKDIDEQIRANHGLAMLHAMSGQRWVAKIDSNRNIDLMDTNGAGNHIVSKFDIRSKNGLLFIVTSVMATTFDW